MSVNRAILLGTIDSPVHIHTPATGGKIANFILVTTEEWRDGKTGLTKSRPERHKIAVFGDKLVDIISSSNIQVGSRIYLEGQIEARTWRDPQNTETTSVDIVVRGGRGKLEVWQ